ncbi:hypothetical protein CRG98_002823 [Punica granatum]|uniref:Uncharacterized protein n=1 Tax=Punica granatum TaxID=22663 RepID=A0A2I0L803_PUNGR|nr:hypothetical protein CRG98_002823 [Punica granatum]
MGHIDRFCKEKSTQQQNEAQAAQEVEHLFVASCYASSIAGSGWLMDSGCTNHMTSDRSLFKEFDGSFSTKVRIGNGDYIAVKGRGIVVIEGYTGAKVITSVLYVPEIDQNLLSVGQLVEKGYKEKNMPLKFWAEAANNVVFLLNRLPTKALEKKTPYEAWHKMKPSVKNLKSKAYIVFQPQTKKVIISRDVAFLEEEKWNWKEGSKGEKGVTQQCWSPQLSRNDEVLIRELKQDLMKVFEMTDLGVMAYFLGMEIKQTQGEIFICQRRYLKEILKRFNMEECISVKTPTGYKEKLQKEDGTEPTDEA